MKQEKIQFYPNIPNTIKKERTESEQRENAKSKSLRAAGFLLYTVDKQSKNCSFYSPKKRVVCNGLQPFATITHF